METVEEEEEEGEWRLVQSLCGTVSPVTAQHTHGHTFTHSLSHTHARAHTYTHSLCK